MDTNLHVKITAEAQQALAAINRVVGGVNSISNKLQGDELTNQNSFFSQSTMALMSGTGSMIKGVGDQISQMTGKVRMSRRATEEALNGLRSMATEETDAFGNVLSVDDQLGKLEVTARNVGESFAISKSEILSAGYALKGGMSFLSTDSLSKMMSLQTTLGAATKASADTTANMLANAGNTLGAHLQNDQKAFQNFQYGFANSSAAIVNVAKAEGNQIAAFTKIVATGLLTKDQSLATQQALAGSFITVTGSGERAATQVSALAAKWSKTFKGFKELGIATQDSNGKLRDMVDVVGDLKGVYDKADAMGKEKILGQLGILGDVNAKRAMQNILTDYNNIVKYKEAANKAILEGQQAFNGELAVEETMMGKMAAAFQRGPGFTMDQLRVKQQNLMEDIAKSVSTAQSPFISLQGAFTNFAQKIVSTNPQLVGAMVSFGESVGGAISGFGGFMSQIGNIGRGMESLKLFKKTMDSFGIMNIFKKKPKESVMSEGMIDKDSITKKVFSLMRNATRRGIAAGMFALHDSSIGKSVDGFVNKFNTSLNQKAPVFSGITSGIGNSLKKVNWKGVGTGILKGVGMLGAGMTLALPFLMKDKDIGPQIQELLGQVTTALKPMLPLLTSLAKDVFKALKPVLPTLLEAFKQLLPPIIDIVKTVVQALLPVLPTLTDLLVTIVRAVVPIIKPITDLLSKLMPIIKPLLEFLRVLVDVGGKIATTILGAITGLISSILDALPDWMLTDEMERTKYAKRLEGGGGTEEERKFAAKSMIINTLNKQAGFENMNQENFDSFMEKLSPEQKTGYQDFINRAVAGKFEGQQDFENTALKQFQDFSSGKVYGTDGSILTDPALQQKMIAQNQAVYGANNEMTPLKKLEQMALSNPALKMSPQYQQIVAAAKKQEQTVVTHNPTVQVIVQGNATKGDATAIGDVVKNHMSDEAYKLDEMLSKRQKADAIRNIATQG